LDSSADLQWLLELPGPAQQAPGGRSCLHALLAAATARMRCALGVLYLPENHFSLLQSGAVVPDEECAELWQRSRVQMSASVRQKRRPLVLNGRGGGAPRCKILLAPIVADAGPMLGVLAFFRPSEACDFRQRHLLLAGHLGRLAAGIVDAQFDSITGLYTREGLEQVYLRVLGAGNDGCHSVLYLDVDQMHVVNELYGFEIGNELLVRVAELLAPPQLPDSALAARIASDRFAVLLPDTDTPVATVLAQQLQERINRLAIGPADNPIDVSVSGGVAALLIPQQGLARALAAAELACKTAKKRGRNRIKVDTCDDGTMLRRHVDAVTVGRLRAVLKADQLVLYAQRIEPLHNPALPGGYEVLVRLDDPTEGIVLPGALITVAERYQMLPAIDRWVVRKTLQSLAARRAVLEETGVGPLLNLEWGAPGDRQGVGGASPLR
jgi:diguanylate cyclase (GGDEF)-like protein